MRGTLEEKYTSVEFYFRAPPHAPLTANAPGSRIDRGQAGKERTARGVRVGGLYGEGKIRQAAGKGPQAGLSSWLTMKSAGISGLHTAGGQSQSFAFQFSVMQSMSLEYSIQLPQGSLM